MRRRALLAVFTGLAALVASTQLAGAQAVERVRISDPARQAHGLPPGLSVELASPSSYNRESVSGSSGRWLGPRFEQRGNPDNAAYSSLSWTVSFDQTQGDAEAVANANIVHGDWARDQRGGISVPHVVGTRAIGTILGYYVMLTPSLTNGDARFEGVLAFPLDTNLHAVVRFEALEPPTDDFVVGSTSASSWNRGQVLLALSGARLQGNLPPKIVAARPYERGASVRGKVVDRYLDAVLGAPVALERNIAGSWKKVAGGKTDQRGFYSLPAGKRGLYRVTVRLSGFTATSREIRAGR